jgi:hypothetical protein
LARQIPDENHGIKDCAEALPHSTDQSLTSSRLSIPFALIFSLPSCFGRASHLIHREAWFVGLFRSLPTVLSAPVRLQKSATILDVAVKGYAAQQSFIPHRG